MKGRVPTCAKPCNLNGPKYMNYEIYSKLAEKAEMLSVDLGQFSRPNRPTRWRMLKWTHDASQSKHPLAIGVQHVMTP
eukprot:scaffold115209_cov43-Prasinocladus_malaysianus.AAC.1